MNHPTFAASRRRYRLIIALGLAVAIPALKLAAAPNPPPLLPAPLQVQWTDGRLALPDGLKIVVPAKAPVRIDEIAELLRDGLRSVAGLSATVSRNPQDAGVAGAVVLSLADPPAGITPPPEAYTLGIGDTVVIGATDPRGLLWGVQTFLQTLMVDGGRVTVPRGEIADRPAREWRVLVIDTVRAFLDPEFIRRTIRVMSAYKMNILMPHLIDDQAWRFESKNFPKVNPPGEPFYSQAELRELVAYAARYGVTIVPEFDFPGHSNAAVKAYPALDCEGKPRDIGDAIFCSGKPFTWEFIEKTLDEIMAVFPSEYIHLGLDEPYAVKRWADCPDCQARMKAKGVTSIEALYHTFVIELNERVQRRGRKLMVANDAIKAGVEPMPPKDILVDGWVRYETILPLAEAGYPLLCSSCSPLFLTSLGFRDGYPLGEILRWNATRFEFPRTKYPNKAVQEYRSFPPHAKILGGHASAWTTEQWLMERRIYPRLLAVAEILWAEGREPTAADFEARYFAAHRANLRRIGVPDYDAMPFNSLDRALIPAADGWERSELGYGDFTLNFEARGPDDATEAGVLLRCASGAATQGFAVPYDAPRGTGILARKTERKGWCRYEISARGPLISLTLDDLLIWSMIDPAPRRGPVAFRAPGSGYEFRNIRIRSMENIK